MAARPRVPAAQSGTPQRACEAPIGSARAGHQAGGRSDPSLAPDRVEVDACGAIAASAGGSRPEDALAARVGRGALLPGYKDGAGSMVNDTGRDAAEHDASQP